MNKATLFIFSLFLLFAQASYAGPISKIEKAYVEKKIAEQIIKREAKKKIAQEALLKNELKVGKYKDLTKQRRLNKNPLEQPEVLDAHHIPSTRFINKHNIDKGEGVAIEMQPQRHAETRTYASKNPAFLQETPRQALARDVKDMKQIYSEKGLYDKTTRGALRNVIEQNKKTFPELYNK